MNTDAIPPITPAEFDKALREMQATTMRATGQLAGKKDYIPSRYEIRPSIRRAFRSRYAPQ